MLIEVNGVGPKTAMEIVGSAKGEEIEAAIRNADVNFFSGIKGIGKKSAQRIIIDLKNKIGSLREVDLSAEEEDSAVFMALKQFGFKSGEIQAVMKKMDRTMSEQAQVREGLKMLGKVGR
jgi:Holliday junction DNA helicase RuvA